MASGRDKVNKRTQDLIKTDPQQERNLRDNP